MALGCQSCHCTRLRLLCHASSGQRTLEPSLDSRAIS